MKTGKGDTILIVDDEAANLGPLFEHLRQANFRVLVAEDGSSALERVRRRQPDIILLDINLPDTDGFELYRRLQKSGSADTPVIFFSARDDTLDKLKGLDLGAVDYITKPFQTQEVIARVEKHLTIHNLRRQLEEQNVQLKQEIAARKRADEALQTYSERLEDMVQERTQELYEAQEKLLRQEKLAILGQLAGGVAHELRNPLGSIRNTVYFLNMVLETPTPEIKDSLQILNRGVDTAERIIHSLLDFARTNVPAWQEVDLNHVIQETLSHVNLPANVQATLQRDEDLPLIQADPDQLERVLDNLIRNAIQAMPNGGRLALQTSARPSQVSEPGWVSISCSDTGVGIPPENLEQLFEPLFTTKSKGIGLGLAITRTLVQAHGGSIKVQSQVGQGSTFTIRLPVGEEKNSASPVCTSAAIGL